MKENHTTLELSIHSMELYRRLSVCAKGDFIGYPELNLIIKMNVQKEGYAYLMRAREMALRKDGLRFEVVRSKGIKCLTDEENALMTGPSYIKKLSRITRKGQRKITAIEDFGALSNEAKIKHNMSMSVLGVFRNLTQIKRLKRIETEVRSKPRELSFNSTITLFKDG